MVRSCTGNPLAYGIPQSPQIPESVQCLKPWLTEEIPKVKISSPQIAKTLQPYLLHWLFGGLCLHSHCEEEETPLNHESKQKKKSCLDTEVTVYLPNWPIARNTKIFIEFVRFLIIILLNVRVLGCCFLSLIKLTSQGQPAELRITL